MSAEQPIILSKQGTPFATEIAAEKHIKKEELDSDVFRVIPYNGRFAILDTTSEAGQTMLAEIEEEDPDEPPKKKAKSQEPERFAHEHDKHPYGWVEFLPRSNHGNEPRDVALSVNGVCLQCQRQVKVPLPREHLAAAREAQHPVYEQAPGHSRQVSSIVSRFPYMYYGPATKDDFYKAFRMGNKLVREFEERHRLEQARAENNEVQ